MNRQVLEFNGNVFETAVQQTLAREFPDAVILHDKKVYSSYLKKDTQIDLVMIDSYGVFVIEAKGWKQWIKGNVGDVYWSGKSQGKDPMKVFSPLDQNFIHVRALRNSVRRLGYEPPIFWNVLCVPDGIAIYSDCDMLCNRSMLAHVIRRLEKKCSERIDVAGFAELVRMAE